MSLYSSDTRLSRQRQITTLKVYNETVEEVVENSEYRVKVKCQTLQVSLIVRLPPEFPGLPPVLICSPALLHPWISTGGRVTGLYTSKYRNPTLYLKYFSFLWEF